MRAVKCLFVFLVHLFVSATGQGDATFLKRKRRKRAWLGSLWWLLVSSQDRPTYNCQIYSICASSSIAAQAAREHVFNGETPGANLEAPVLERSQTRIVWRVNVILLWRLLFSWSSPLRMHHYFSQQGFAQRPNAMPYEGKEASPSVSKTLVRPKCNPSSSIEFAKKCACVILFNINACGEHKCLLVVHCQMNKAIQ